VATGPRSVVHCSVELACGSASTANVAGHILPYCARRFPPDGRIRRVELRPRPTRSEEHGRFHLDKFSSGVGCDRARAPWTGPSPCQPWRIRWRVREELGCPSETSVGPSAGPILSTSPCPAHSATSSALGTPEGPARGKRDSTPVEAAARIFLTKSNGNRTGRDAGPCSLSPSG
jgi:hypothetical protein